MKHFTILNLIFSMFVSPLFVHAQFNESFENPPATYAFPSGWTVINGGGVNKWITNIPPQTYPAHSGQYVASIFHDGVPHDDYLVTPQITVIASVSDYLVFSARNRLLSFLETVSVKVSVTTPTPEAFIYTLDDNVTPMGNNNGIWQKYKYDLSQFAGQQIYIAFYISTNDVWIIDIDDVEITSKPNCMEVANISFSDVEINSATISWQSNAPLFEIKYGLKNFDFDNQGTTVTSENATLTLENLQQGTFYDVYIRAKCNATDISEWSQAQTFRTTTPSVTAFPFHEKFDTSAIPQDWYNEYVLGEVDWTFVAQNVNQTIAPFSAPYMAQFQSEYIGMKTKLVSPPLNISQMQKPTIKFVYANAHWYTDVDEMRIFYKTSYENEWIQFGEEYTSENLSWEEAEYILPEKSEKFYIAFEGKSNYSRGFDLDNIEVFDAFTDNVENINDTFIAAYYNCENKMLNINSSFKMIISVSIFNSAGQKNGQQTIRSNNCSINCNGYAKGFYLLKINYEGGVKTIKFIIS